MSEDKQLRVAEVIDLDGIMKQSGGRKFLARLLQKTMFLESSFNPDSRVTAFNEGKREIGQWLYREMREANPGALKQILEAHDDGRNY